MTTKHGWLAGLVTLSLSWAAALLPPTVLAQEQKDGAWEWLVAPYIRGTGIDGAIGAGGHETSANADFSDLVNFANIAAVVQFEAMNKPMGAIPLAMIGARGSCGG